MDILKFAEIVGKLKRVKRTGWVIKKVKDPESVAEHIFRMAILAMILSTKFNLDQLKVLKMVLIHDLGEAEIGDLVKIPKYSKESIESIRKKERKAMVNILSELDNGDDYVAIYDEYEKKESKEARFVKQVDKLEVLLQALEYEKEQAVDLQEFFDIQKPMMVDEFFKELFKEIDGKRKG